MYVDRSNATSDTLVLGNEEGSHTAQKIPGSSSAPVAVPPMTHCLPLPLLWPQPIPKQKSRTYQYFVMPLLFKLP